MVLSISIGGVTVKGTQVRSLFALRSAAFTVAAEDGNIVFHVTGYGHGVGMSQYGANTMAQQGKTYLDVYKRQRKKKNAHWVFYTITTMTPSWLQNYPPAKTFVMPATRFRLPT